ncbi:integrase arm-type DNA-binding domain-containing protein [Mesorhizobium sp. M0060]|uniref:tyrosine-type recombinase/integrase n=1 Tax=Mesorhizobium sp. M0060 TaxID=2956866 RepID=UPI00333BAD7B
MAKAFTVKFIETIKPTDKRQEIPDGGLPGLYLIVQPSGKMSWAVRYRFGGKMLKYTIGSYPAFGLADARKEAGKILRAASEGRDPQAEKKQAKTAQATGDDLFENVIAEFIKRHVKKKNRDSTAKDQQRFIDNELLPRWKGRRIGAITKRDVNAMLNEVVDRGAPQSANRVLALVRKFFNWCVGTEWLDASPCTGIPTPAPITKRKRVLSPDEIRLVWKGAEAIGWPFGPLTQLLLLTGQRREEVAGASWREFDLDAKQPAWTIPEQRAKNGNSNIVALAPAALAVLASLPRIGGKGDLVLTTNGETSISGYSRGKRRLDEAMLAAARKEAEERGDDPGKVAIPEWTLHDLRRTLATRGGDLGVLPHTIEAILNHARVGVSAHYNHARYEAEKRAALIRWAAYVERLVAGKAGLKCRPVQNSAAMNGCESTP